jgi:hypothetical protein
MSILMKVKETIDICKDRKWEKVISIYPNGKRAYYNMYVTMLLIKSPKHLSVNIAQVVGDQ